MSELIDFRLNVTPEPDHWLEAMSKATGRCKKEIAREVFHEIALKKIHEINIANSYLFTKGLSADK
jgi:predicted DNA-binding protein